MARPGITYEQVAEVADNIQERGETPTILKVRHGLGDTGSNSNIGRHLITWRKEKLAANKVGLLVSKTHLTDPLSKAVVAMRQKVLEECQEEIQQIRQEAELKINEAQAARLEAEESLLKVQTINDQLTVQLSHIETDLKLAQQALLNEKQQRQILENKNADLEASFLNYQEELDKRFKETQTNYQLFVANYEKQAQEAKESYQKSLNEFKEINENQRQQFMLKVDKLEVSHAKLEEANKKLIAELAKSKTANENLEENIRVLEVKIIAKDDDNARASKTIEEKESIIATLREKIAVQSESMSNAKVQEDIKLQLEAINMFISTNISTNK